MPTLKYNEIIKLKLKDLSKAMEDMTFLYKETKVPSSHYEGILKETVEEDFADIVQTNVLNAYYSTFKNVLDENPREFILVLLCLQEKIKPSDLKACERLALNISVDEFLQKCKKHPNFLNDSITQRYDNILENGILSENDINDENERLN